VLALVGQSRLQKRQRRQLGDVGLGRSDIDQPAVTFDLIIGAGSRRSLTISTFSALSTSPGLILPLVYASMESNSGG